MEKIGLFPGSFDPITKGHVDIIQRALPLFDQIIIGIGENSNKSYLFDLETRTNWIKRVFANYNKIRVTTYSGLTVNFCLEVGASFIIRGLRSSPDFEYEKNIAQFNKVMKGVDTLFLITEPVHSPISSTIVRDVIRNNGNPTPFLPDEIASDFNK